MVDQQKISWRHRPQIPGKPGRDGEIDVYLDHVATRQKKIKKRIPNFIVGSTESFDLRVLCSILNCDFFFLSFLTSDVQYIPQVRQEQTSPQVNTRGGRDSECPHSALLVSHEATKAISHVGYFQVKMGLSELSFVIS